MFVGDVYFARTPSAETLSAERPVVGFVIITNECHVAAAYVSSVFLCVGVTSVPFAWTAAAGPASAATAATTSKRFISTPLWMSSLEPGVRDALGELPLEQQERDDDREHERHGSRHQQAIVGLVLPDRERPEGDRQRVHVLVGQHDQRPEEVVPRAEEHDDRERGHARQRQRHDDPP